MAVTVTKQTTTARERKVESVLPAGRLSAPEPLVCPSSDLLAEIDRVVEIALKEDLRGLSDITSASIIPPDVLRSASVTVKQPGIIAGLVAFGRVFQHIDPDITFTVHLPDGTAVADVPVVCATVFGCARSILTGERTALNLMQRLSGIATMTHRFARLAQEHGIAIYDTRKTTPGLRVLEKYAVAIGGGSNHRFGLFDDILIKDNHVRIAGSVREAVSRARQAYPGQALEVEVCNLAEVRQAVQAQAEKIMLDNMSPELVRQAVALIGGRSFVEVSGGINSENISAYLLPGVNAISIGALTHSACSMDISLEIEG